MFELPAPTADSDPVTASQARNNRSTEKQWQMYAGHRQAIERLIVPAEKGQSICVLGAGNCNDLDLAWLTQMYREVHLVDLDREALEAGIARQLKQSPEGLRLHAPFDLTGIAGRVAAWKGTPSEPEMAEAARLAAAAVEVSWEKCDVVLSPCVLTQTINPVRDAARGHYSATEPAVMALRAALRARHLRVMRRSLKPGGRGVLAVDFISSEAFKDLARVPAPQLANLMDRFIADGKGYRGLDPASVERAIRDAGLNQPRFVGPWMWHLGLRKSFLVYAMTFRSGEESGASLAASATGLF
jgi:hypothetical protein